MCASPPGPFVYPIAGTMAEGGLHWSSPWIKKLLLPGPVKVTLFPARVSAAVNPGAVRLGNSTSGLTTYCNIFWLPLGRTAQELISSACEGRAEGGGAIISINPGAIAFLAAFMLAGS